MAVFSCVTDVVSLYRGLPLRAPLGCVYLQAVSLFPWSSAGCMFAFEVHREVLLLFYDKRCVRLLLQVGNQF